MAMSTPVQQRVRREIEREGEAGEERRKEGEENEKSEGLRMGYYDSACIYVFLNMK